VTHHVVIHANTASVTKMANAHRDVLSTTTVPGARPCARKTARQQNPATDVIVRDFVCKAVHTDLREKTARQVSVAIH